ncbi:MAG: hypothetical protein AAGF12_13435 [Myxococcota bacterium]
MQEQALDRSLAEDDLLRSDAYIVEWYRLDQNAQIVKVLALGALLMAPGSALVGVGISPYPIPELLRILLTLLGALMTVGGPAICILGLRNVMAVDSYIALRTDGLVCHLSPSPTLTLWENIIDIEADGEVLVLVLRDDTTERIDQRFNGIRPEELVKRMREVRRKALFGLL